MILHPAGKLNATVYVFNACGPHDAFNAVSNFEALTHVGGKLTIQFTRALSATQRSNTEFILQFWPKAAEEGDEREAKNCALQPRFC